MAFLGTQDVLNAVYDSTNGVLKTSGGGGGGGGAVTQSDPTQLKTQVFPVSQVSTTTTLQSAATADGNGTVATVDGYNGAQSIEIQKTGAGTCTVTYEGSFDSTTWYGIGFVRIDGQVSRTLSVTPVAVGAGTVNRVDQVQDIYPKLRARISATSGSVSVTAKVYLLGI